MELKSHFSFGLSTIRLRESANISDIQTATLEQTDPNQMDCAFRQSSTRGRCRESPVSKNCYPRMYAHPFVSTSKTEPPRNDLHHKSSEVVHHSPRILISEISGPSLICKTRPRFDGRLGIQFGQRQISNFAKKLRISTMAPRELPKWDRMLRTYPDAARSECALLNTGQASLPAD